MFEIMVQKIFRNKYIPTYQVLNLPWYERDGLITFIDQLKHKRFIDNSDIKNGEIANFDNLQ